jgi:hypothetical protein
MLLQVTTPNLEINITNDFEVIYDFSQNKFTASELRLFVQNLILTPN